MKNHGFSLIELMVTLAIIAILAIVIYPSYSNPITKAQRNYAKVALLHLASRMEHHYLTFHNYKITSLRQLGVNQLTIKDGYQLRIATADEKDYLLQAIPLVSEKKCGILWLDQTGKKGLTGTANINECW